MGAAVTRVGLLSGAAYYVGLYLLVMVFVPADLHLGYAGATWLAVGGISALGAFGCFTSTITANRRGP